MKERPILFSGPMVRAILSGAKTQTRRVVNMKQLRVSLDRPVTSDLAALLPEWSVSADVGKHRAELNPHGAVSCTAGDRMLGLKPGEFDFVCPYADGATHHANYGHGRKGWMITPRGSNRLWVRETFGFVKGNGVRTVYRADGEEPRETLTDRTIPGMKWTPSIFMRRRHSRITLEISSVRLERLQAITEADAKAEGVETRTGIYGPGDCVAGAHRIVSARTAFHELWDGINAKRGHAWDGNPWVWAITFGRVPT